MTLKELSTELIAAKKLETEAKAKRIEIEKMIFDLVGADVGADFQVSSLYSYQADPASLMLATMSWPAELQPAYLSPRIDETRLGKIKNEMPALWKQIAHLIDIQYKQINLSVLVD
jgi:hypothetical protein